MSVKLSKRLSSKKKKPPKDNAQTEILQKLGLEAYSTTPLDPASILDISTWTLEDKAPLELKDLPNAFLRRLWLLSQDARSPCCQPQQDIPNNDNKSPEEKLNGCEGEGLCAINSLDLVTSVFMSANSFLQQEMTVRMVQCQFAVPLVLPNIDPGEPSHFLLWPLRSVLSQWMSHSLDTYKGVQEGNLASTSMPMVSCVKLGRCSVSKSQVLNHVLNGLKSHRETFVHRGMDGGQLPRRLSNGLVEIGWYLPSGDIDRDIFPVPVVISNLRGDASTHEKCLKLLCQASSAVVVFCGDLREKEKQLLMSCKNMASKLILIDLSDSETKEKSTVGFVDQNLKEHMGLPEESVLQGSNLTEEEVAEKLCKTLKGLLPDRLKFVTLEAAAKLALEIGLSVDEGPICKKVMATVEEMLKGLDEGSAEFRMKQLPLQGPFWSKLAELDKEESKQSKEGTEIDPQLQKEKRDIMAQLSSYKMTPAMKIFTDALFTTDKTERTYFLTWLKLRLHLMQSEKQKSSQETFAMLKTEKKGGMSEHLEELEHGDCNSVADSDSFCSVSTTDKKTKEHPELQASEKRCSDEEISHQISDDQSCHVDSGENGTLRCEGKHLDQSECTSAKSDLTSAKLNMGYDALTVNLVASCSQLPEPDPNSLAVEHFLREMGLIFELTHISPGSGSQNVLGLPSLATDLLLYGVPLELMDGDASNIPMCWLGCVFAELKRRLPQDQLRTRVLTNLGVYHARNAEVLSALFGVKFPENKRRLCKGVYMVALCVPDDLRKDMECDFLFIIDVEGLCSVSVDNTKNILTHDNEMATFATGLSDVLLQNISPHSDKFETTFTVIVNALLRTKEHDSLPICQLLAQDEELNSKLQTSQLSRISEMLQTEREDSGNADNQNAKTTVCTTCVKGPWSNMSVSELVDTQYSEAVLKLKENLFEALKSCAAKSTASGLPEFMAHLCSVWDAVKSESFSIGLKDTDIALAFSLLCTEFSRWEGSFLENMESWLRRASMKIFATKAKALDAAVENDLLDELKNEAQEEVQSEINKMKSKVDTYLMKDDLLKMDIKLFRPILMSNMVKLQNHMMEEIVRKLKAITENHCSLTQLKKFESLLEEQQDFKLLALVETSKSTKLLLQDTELEEEFEDVWNKTLSNFNFRPSETDDITAAVTDTLRQNLISRGFQKHMKKLDTIGQNQTPGFQVYDEHFGYRSRLKHMFEDNNRQQRLEAQQTASKIIDEYSHFVADKCSLPADFTCSYIVELLENIEKSLKEKSMDIRSAFEVDLKIYICNAACQDFQKLHDRFSKDKELLMLISATKSKYLAEFIYHFRKRDQCQRVAQAFTTMVIKPTVLDYINGPLGMQIAEEIKDKAIQYRSPQAFQQSLLEELIKEDHFESFVEYLLTYDGFRLRKIQETVVAHLSESTSLGKWKQQRLGEIVGKVASAVSQITEDTNGVLSDTKPLLERMCLILERDADVDVTRDSLNGPLFSITTEWDRFVKCLMELLATLRLDLVQEFSQNVDIPGLLNCVPVQPQDCLFKRVKGCDKQCPLCSAPCEEEELGHEIHKTLLHRPKGMLPYDSPSLPSSNIMTCKDLHSLHPNWSNSYDDPSSQKGSSYWRYVLARFNERFAEEFNQEPVIIPEEWRKITQEEALDSLKKVFPN
ncbi:interferon-induced very large GTPase 1 [Odontesthes bonariensis]|uniref:interferon-induced very large GTPase 1 n=1 Tax=Odontesthes bonariensis TaxID=219752 RepID=UPI003F58C801